MRVFVILDINDPQDINFLSDKNHDLQILALIDLHWRGRGEVGRKQSHSSDETTTMPLCLYLVVLDVSS